MQIEHGLYGLAFLVGLVVRLLNLGVLPLSDVESSWALQAWEAAKGGQAALGSQPIYLALTSLHFSLFGSSNFGARLWPALVGSVLVLAPLLFRDRVGRLAGLVMAFGLALDPGLVALSRQAGGPMLALGFTMLALGFANARRPVAAGVFAGLASLAGLEFLHGALGIGLSGLVFWLLTRRDGLAESGLPDQSLGGSADLPSLRSGLLAAGATVLVAGTLFGRLPQGLGAWLATLPAFLQSWIAPSGIPAGRLVLALLVYQPLATLFALVGSLRAWLSGLGTDRTVSIWLFVAFLLALLLPSRQVNSLVWVMIPLWTLAARELVRHLQLDPARKWVAIGQATAIFILLVLFWVNLAGISQPAQDGQAISLRLGALAAVLALGVVATILVGMGWSWQTARWGAIVGLCAALGMYNLSSLMGSSHLSAASRNELWEPAPLILDADLVVKTISDLSQWETGRLDSIDIVVAVEASSLRWALRNFPHVIYISEDASPLGSSSPSLVIARQSQQEPALAAAYRGQDFVWWNSSSWEGVFPPDMVRWLVFRSAPVQPELLILWARSDLFPAEVLAPQELPNQNEEIDPALQDIQD